MTPTAVTRAARRKQTKAPTRGSATSSARSAGHRATVNDVAGPATPRRVSGPLGGAAPPGRVSGPARSASHSGTAAPKIARPRTARPRTAAPRTSSSLGERALTFVKTLPDRQLLDRIVRGRAWIPLLGVLLAGIVAMQVEVLKLGAGMGRSIERSTELQSRNELLRESVATLSDDQRIERLAAGMGMVMAAPAAINFLFLRPGGYVQRAVANIQAPDASGFLASLPASDTPPPGAAASTSAAINANAAANDGTATPATNANAAANDGTVTPATDASDTSSSDASSSTGG